MSSTTPVILNTPYLYGATNTAATPVVTSGSAPVYTYGAASATPIVGGTRSFVLPGSTPVVAGSTAPVYTYGAASATPIVGGTRSFVFPGSTPVVAAAPAPAPAPVAATSSATLTKSGVVATSSSAAAPVVVPVAAPAPVVAAPIPAAAPVAPAFFGTTRSYVVPPNGYAPAAPAHVPGTRDFVLPGSAPAGCKLAVKVVDVTNLPNPAWDATDPYVVVRVGTAAKKTTIKEDAGANATWNETLRFDGVTATYATLEVYDENLLGDEHLGSATVSLAPGNYAIPFTTHEKKRAVLRVSISDE